MCTKKGNIRSKKKMKGVHGSAREISYGAKCRRMSRHCAIKMPSRRTVKSFRQDKPPTLAMQPSHLVKETMGPALPRSPSFEESQPSPPKPRSSRYHGAVEQCYINHRVEASWSGARGAELPHIRGAELPRSCAAQTALTAPYCSFAQRAQRVVEPAP